ncbi:PTS sugar transporter subunit IIA [Acetivibrio ethanolgignens]|nr:PTS sugar transporter subunit IIA [Acetivibrio ethanolgignens]
MAKELMSGEIVMFDVESDSSEEIIRLIADAMDKDDRLIDKEGYITDVMSREASSSTAVGFSIATPHSKSVYVKRPSLAFVRLAKPVKWDGTEEVDMVFQIGVPSPGQGDRHLEILAGLFRKVMHDDFREQLRSAKNAEEVIELIGMV